MNWPSLSFILNPMLIAIYIVQSKVKTQITSDTAALDPTIVPKTAKLSPHFVEYTCMSKISN